MRVLYVTPEAHPLIKTGGLADVSGALPAALAAAGAEPRLLLPAYQSVLARLHGLRTLASFRVEAWPAPVELLVGEFPGSGLPLYLIASPGAFDRPGNPYVDASGADWPDNAERFAMFCRAAVRLANDDLGLGWVPELVHCHDWQTGLIPALLAAGSARPATLFTIHNLAYQGLFDRQTFRRLGLPEVWWTLDGVEFWGRMSFMKAGLAFADQLSTVSPRYAEEIRQPTFGYGLEGLLQRRSADLHGILNGVDYRIWDPRHDRLIPHNYDADHAAGKARDKRALQKVMGLAQEAAPLLLGHVGRMVSQKGMDLIADCIPELAWRGVQLAVLGSGDKALEARLAEAATAHGWFGLRLGYDEALAHLIEAGADAFLMPSRFEPCGLNQLYSLRYGTLPIVRRVGGLADSVVHADAAALSADRATGVVFDGEDAAALLAAIDHTLVLRGQTALWRQVQRRAMAQDFSWARAAGDYLLLYARAVQQLGQAA